MREYTICYATVYRLRDHPFMDELVYVWNLKKQLNLIYRKQHRIEPLIEDDNVDAMVVMNYMYQGSKQLYELDDNLKPISSRYLGDEEAAKAAAEAVANQAKG